MKQDTETRKAPSILLVDDEDHFRNRLQKAFVRRGFIAVGAGGFDEAVDALKNNRFDYAVFDLRMPGKSGLDLIREAKKMQSDLKIVVLTGYGSIATATEAIKQGALYYLPKPADVDDILAAFVKDSDEDVAEATDEIPTPSLARAEWEHINRVLSDCNGNISAAAKRLNVHRRTLQRKLLKYPPRE